MAITPIESLQEPDHVGIITKPTTLINEAVNEYNISPYPEYADIPEPLELESKLAQANLVYIYDNAYEKAIGSEEEKSVSARETLDKAAAEMNMEAAIVANGNRTAMVIYNPQLHSTTVCFDGTTGAADGYDLVHPGRLFKQEHPLGGTVQDAFYDTIVEELSPADAITGQNTMLEAIEAHIHSFASRDYGSPLTVNFSGFSAGGSMTTLCAGEMIHNGLFDFDEIKMGDIYAFGSVGTGDEEFKQILENRTKELGGNVWDIRLHGDKISTALTPDNEYLPVLTSGSLTHVGTLLYVIPEDPASIMVNPSKEEIETLPSAEENTHDTNLYLGSFQSMQSSPENINVSGPKEEMVSAPTFSP